MTDGSTCLNCRRLIQENDRLRLDNDRLRQDNTDLKAALDEAHRAGKRQAAPFSKGPPKKRPKRPGRRPGRLYGKKAYRRPPDRVDRVVDAPLPECCPDPECGGAIEELEVKPQFQEEIPPVKPIITRFDVHVGRCLRCSRRVQGRAPEQTSDALGAAAAQLGPRAVALAAELNKGMGIPFGKVSALFSVAFTLTVTRAGLCLALHRLAKAARPTYQHAVLLVRQSKVVSPDESGWKVGGELWWLWVFATAHVTVYAILPGRGFEQAASVLGSDYSGTLERDGWAPYRKFKQANHQSCFNHLKRRCHEMLETAKRGAARIPHAVRRILDDALKLRERRQSLSPRGLAIAVGKLSARVDRLLDWKPKDDANRKLLKHLRNEKGALFTFLRKPGVEATNWRAEQAIRPAVVTRKVCGGNRSERGAETQSVLATILRTSRQNNFDPLAVFEELLRIKSPEPASQFMQLSPQPDDRQSQRRPSGQLRGP